MKLIVEMELNQPDDDVARGALGFYLHVLGQMFSRHVPTETTEGKIRDEHAAVIGKWRIEP